jgi:hypothetical protein
MARFPILANLPIRKGGVLLEFLRQSRHASHEQNGALTGKPTHGHAQRKLWKCSSITERIRGLLKFGLFWRQSEYGNLLQDQYNPP